LHQLVKDRPGALFLHFSSVTSFFGGALFGGYAAANRYLDHFAHLQRRRGTTRSVCLAWSAWKDVGMSRSHAGKQPLRAQGRGIGASRESGGRAWGFRRSVGVVMSASSAVIPSWSLRCCRA